MNSQKRTVSRLEPHEIDLQTVVCLERLANSEKVNKMLCFQGVKTDRKTKKPERYKRMCKRDGGKTANQSEAIQSRGHLWSCAVYRFKDPQKAI